MGASGKRSGIRFSPMPKTASQIYESRVQYVLETRLQTVANLHLTHIPLVQLDSLMTTTMIWTSSSETS